MQARFGRLCCRETIRAALHRLDRSWKKAKKLLGRAHPERRKAFVGRPRPLLDGAQRDRHQLVYWDEAHIHQDVDLGRGWGERSKRLFVASSSPGLSAKVSLLNLSFILGCVLLYVLPLTANVFLITHLPQPFLGRYDARTHWI